MNNKKTELLQPLNNEYRQALLFCWHLRQGFNRSVDKERMKLYSDWFYQNYLANHFLFEEDFIFTQLDRKNEIVSKARSYHRKLKRLFLDEGNSERSLCLIEEQLEAYIRFERQKMCDLIVNNIAFKRLSLIMNLYTESILFEDWGDPFWKKSIKH